MSAVLNVTSQQESHIQQVLLPALARIVRDQFLACPQELGVELLRLQGALGHGADGSILNAIWGCCYEKENNNKKRVAATGVNDSYICIRQFSDAELGL